jgi:ABC-2 type transport system ATP-binding protein
VAQGTPDELKGELRGDAVHIELGSSLADQAEVVRSALERVHGVREVAIDGHRLSARADDGASVVPSALAALDQAGVRVAAVTVARPSLDDVYLRYAGRRFDEADSASSDEFALALVGGAR